MLCQRLTNLLFDTSFFNVGRHFRQRKQKEKKKNGTVCGEEKVALKIWRGKKKKRHEIF